MQFVVYIAVVLFAVFSVALELDALVEPIATNQHVARTVQPAVPRVDDKTGKARSAAPITMGPAAPPASVAQPRTAASASTVGAAPEMTERSARANAPTTTGAAPAESAAPAAPPADKAANDNAATSSAVAPASTETPGCDVDACAAAYSSFRAADCSYQPYEGARRACTKGEAGRAAARAAEARAQAGPVSFAACNRRACAEAYSSFNPSNCTYQPFDGPRQLCRK